jgi:hypothetical protein
MAMKKLGNLCVSTGEYTDSSGELKKRWSTIGVALQDERGIVMKFDLLPAMSIGKNGYPEAWVKIFPDAPKEQTSHHYAKSNGYQTQESQAPAPAPAPRYTAEDRPEQQQFSDDDILF